MDMLQKMVGMARVLYYVMHKGAQFEEHMLWCPMLGAIEGGIILVLEHHVRELH